MAEPRVSALPYASRPLTRSLTCPHAPLVRSRRYGFLSCSVVGARLQYHLLPQVARAFLPSLRKKERIPMAQGAAARVWRHSRSVSDGSRRSVHCPNRPAKMEKSVRFTVPSQFMSEY